MAEIGQSLEQLISPHPIEQDVNTVATQSASPITNEQGVIPKPRSLIDRLRKIISFGASEAKKSLDEQNKLNPFSKTPPQTEGPTS